MDLKQYSTYLIKDDELLLEGFDYYNPLTSEREHKLLNPNQIILKLPKKSSIAEWKTADHNKTEWNCKAELISVEIDGVNRDAIKLTKRIVADKKYKWANSIEYYVQGIGLWKVCIEETGGIFKLLNRQY